MKTLAIYLHWPYCRSICPYCHFNRFLNRPIKVEQWYNTFSKELQYWALYTKYHKVVSIFFGGGTPSLMEPDLVHAVLERIASLWPASEKIEITLEMNPSDVEKVMLFRSAGVNRFSIGIQSFDPEVLSHFGRTHDAAYVQGALSHIQSCHVDYSFDLMYGHKFHKETERWVQDLNQAVKFLGNHLSVYQLSYEEGTPFYRKRGQELSSEKLLELEACTQSILGPLGLELYEISNYGRPGYESRHNLQYWNYDDFLGIGPGAHGRIRLSSGTRRAVKNHNDPKHWMNAVENNGHGAEIDDILGVATVFQELLLMTLRLQSGLPLEKIYNECTPSLGFFRRLEHCVQGGLIMPFDRKSSDAALILTAKGRNVLNSIVEYLYQPKEWENL